MRHFNVGEASRWGTVPERFQQKKSSEESTSYDSLATRRNSLVALLWVNGVLVARYV